MKCFLCNVGVQLAADGRVGFRDACEQCGGDLHICKNCSFYDPSAYNECREPGAERVTDAERGNHCDWFKASDETGGESKRAGTLSDLDALFKK